MSTIHDEKKNRLSSLACLIMSKAVFLTPHGTHVAVGRPLTVGEKKQQEMCNKITELSASILAVFGCVVEKKMKDMA